jgi:hypothetical protein
LLNAISVRGERALRTARCVMSLGYQRPIQPRSRSLVLPFINQVAKQVSKKFFFGKKNQKTFIPGVASVASGRFKNKKFFASFFQKRSASLLVPVMPT